MAAPKLSPYDIDQPAWQIVKAHYEKRLALLRSRLENPTWPIEQRTDLIARIDEIKDLLAIGQPEQKNVAGAGE